MPPKQGHAQPEVALIFPPATDPRSPHLALPSLTAALRRAGVRVEQIDLDLESLLHLLSPERLLRAVETSEQRLRVLNSIRSREGSRLRSSLDRAAIVLEGIEPALRTLRDEVEFYQPQAFHHARECIVSALELTSAASGAIHYSIGPIRYDVEGFDASKIGDLACVTADPRFNLFEEYYDERVLQTLQRERPLIVGVSILNHQQILPGLRLCRRLKERGHFVVIGGTVYAKFVPQLLRCPQFFQLFCDAIVPYEGETAILELLNQLRGGGAHQSSEPDFLDAGRSPQDRSDPCRRRRLAADPRFWRVPAGILILPRPVLPILTGKGCYFNLCKFCDIPFINSVSRKPYRVRSPERIARDVATLHERHGARHFVITDEALSPRLLLEIGEALKEVPAVAPRFVGYARFERGFTEDCCRQLFEMGVRKLCFGLESGSQATLDHMRKGYRLEDAVAVLKNCRQAGIAFHLFSIVGFPEETEARAAETLKFFLDHYSLLNDPRNSFDIHPFSLELRTEYGEFPDRYGIEIDEVLLSGQDFPISVDRWRNVRGLSETAAPPAHRAVQRDSPRALS